MVKHAGFYSSDKVSNVKRVIQTGLWLALLFWVLTPKLQAAEAESSQQSSWEWELDIGLAASYGRGLIDDAAELDEEVSLAVLLSGGAYYGDFYIESNPTTHHPLTIGYVLDRQKNHEINLVLESYFYTIEDQQPEEQNLLSGIKTRQASVEAGIEYLTSFDEIDLRARLLHDVLSRHRGSIASVELARAYFTRHYFILPTVSVTYLSQSAVNYYYGVEQEEVNSERALYSAGDGMIGTVSVYIERPLDDQWSLVSYAGYSKFNSAITNSPLAQPRVDAFKIGLGVLWSF